MEFNEWENKSFITHGQKLNLFNLFNRLGSKLSFEEYLNKKFNVENVDLITYKKYYQITIYIEKKIKLNDEELVEVAHALGSNSDVIEDNILFLSKETNTKTICVTKGKDGATLYIDNQFYSHKGFEVKVVDTIGAGDSFLAALLSKVLYTDNYQKAIEFGCAVGALIASHKGSNPVISEKDTHYKPFGEFESPF